jgi:nucleotide-binding universal stress UspA family protein
LRRILVDDATERLQLAGRRVRNLCDLSERVETGSAWRAILRVAEETDADLIVLGAHAPGVVGRFFFGSTANQVVRHAPCPVLVVRKLRAAVRSEAEERGSLAAVGCGA